MEINYLINHTHAPATENKALSKGVNPSSANYKRISDSRRQWKLGDPYIWFSIVVDTDDDYVLFTDFITDEEAMRRFAEYPMTTIEL